MWHVRGAGSHYGQQQARLREKVGCVSRASEEERLYRANDILHGGGRHLAQESRQHSLECAGVGDEAVPSPAQGVRLKHLHVDIYV